MPTRGEILKSIKVIGSYWNKLQIFDKINYFKYIYMYLYTHNIYIRIFREYIRQYKKRKKQ